MEIFVVRERHAILGEALFADCTPNVLIGAYEFEREDRATS
jgi:hypothetical protein